MALGRVVAGLTASLAVAGCAMVAIGMSQASSGPPADIAEPSATFRLPTVHTAKPTFAALSSAVPTTTTPERGTNSAVAPATASHPPTTAAAPTSAPPARPAATTTRPAATRARSTPARTTSAAPRPAAAQRGVSLPLRYPTGTATRVITVTAHSYGSTAATLQAWSKVTAGGWRRYGSSVTAHVGSQGLTTHASESRSATPVGSFTLTRAFGRYSDPGTALPYLHTNSHDWWVSQAGRYYNTHVRCSSSCPIRQDPNVNEHLYYEMPYYRYAVVIDYNTTNAPGGVRAGAGSAFFLHVTDGRATAGCVAIGQAKLISLMRWLTPSAHPRIIIGVV